MFTPEEFEEKRKKYLRIAEIEFKQDNQQLEKYFNANFVSWIKNAKTFRQDYPLETGIFWTEIIRSDFTIKALFEGTRYSKAEVLKLSNREKKEFIEEYFESIYEHFGFLTFCIDYQKEKIPTLREDWFYPLDAKEFSRKKRNCWQVGKDFVSGKAWVMENCPLYDHYDGDISIIKDIRNKGSHYKMIASDDKLFLLNEGKSSDITNEVNPLVSFLIDTLNITYFFHLKLFIENRFWIFPSIILTFPERFNYNKRDINFDIMGALVPKKTKTKKLKFDNYHSERLSFLSILGLRYSIFDIWKTLLEEKDNINSLVKRAGLSFSNENLNSVREKSLILLKNTLHISSLKIKELILGEEVEISEINSENNPSFSVESLFKEFIESYRKARSIGLKSEKKETLLLFSIIPIFLGVFSPLSELKDHYKTLFSDNDS